MSTSERLNVNVRMPVNQKYVCVCISEAIFTGLDQHVLAEQGSKANLYLYKSSVEASRLC